MPRHLHRRFTLFFFFFLATAGCQRAERYGAVKLSGPSPGPDEAPKVIKAEAHYAWREPVARKDLPIKFVPSTSPEWDQLPGFWSITPHPVAGPQTVHFGQSPLGALAALLLAEQLDIAIAVKVPLGLPEPAYPRANPPTYLKWDLGKRLFFDPKWLVQGDSIACATCHNPEEGFTQRRPPLTEDDMDVPSLINCVYNRHQFWDGRVQELEQVIQRDLTDEDLLPVPGPSEARPSDRHSWNRIVHRLDKDEAYQGHFRKVFGTRPTQDNVAKALATYLRTLLAGNSIYDRAKQAADRRGAGAPVAADFEAAVDLASVKTLEGGVTTRAEAAAELVKGYQLFLGRAGCVQCHPAPLFTDHDFHNVGVRESDFIENRTKTGEETGRFRWVPVGLKEKRLIGAFRTPALRNLPQTRPYFHNGSSGLIEGVVEYFNTGLEFQDYLDPLLLESPTAVRRLNLQGSEVRSLAIFLRALAGDPVPPVIAAGRKD